MKNKKSFYSALSILLIFLAVVFSVWFWNSASSPISNDTEEAIVLDPGFERLKLQAEYELCVENGQGLWGVIEDDLLRYKRDNGEITLDDFPELYASVDRMEPFMAVAPFIDFLEYSEELDAWVTEMMGVSFFNKDAQLIGLEFSLNQIKDYKRIYSGIMLSRGLSEEAQRIEFFMMARLYQVLGRIQRIESFSQNERDSLLLQVAQVAGYDSYSALSEALREKSPSYVFLLGSLEMSHEEYLRNVLEPISLYIQQEYASAGLSVLDSPFLRQMVTQQYYEWRRAVPRFAKELRMVDYCMFPPVGRDDTMDAYLQLQIRLAVAEGPNATDDLKILAVSALDSISDSNLQRTLQEEVASLGNLNTFRNAELNFEDIYYWFSGSWANSHISMLDEHLDSGGSLGDYVYFPQLKEQYSVDSSWIGAGILGREAYRIGLIKEYFEEKGLSLDELED